MPRLSLLNWIWYGLGRMTQWVLGWQVEGQLPPGNFIIIAPHTSNMDLVIALMGVAVLSRGLVGLHFRWLGKSQLFRPPQGWLFRRIGGICVDRTASHDLVQKCIDAFAQHEHMALIITPEGTRKARRRWKTGFYYIAQGAGVPILCGTLDYRRKVVGAGLLLTVSGDITADMIKIKAFYEGMTPRHPDKLGEISVPGMEGDAGASGTPARPLEPQPGPAGGTD